MRVQNLFDRGDDLLSLFAGLFLGPQQSDRGGDAAAHDVVAGGEFGVCKGGEGLKLRVGQVVEAGSFFEVVPFADIVPVVLIPVKIAGEDVLLF